MLEKLRAALKLKTAALDALMAKDNLTTEEMATLEKLTGEIEAESKQIETLEKAQRARAAVTTGDATTDKSKVPATAKNKDERDPNLFFKSFGDQLLAIAKAGINRNDQNSVDKRLVWKTPSGANESVPTEGGYLVQQDYSTEILGLVHEQGDILRRVRKIPIGPNSNGLKLPYIDETSRADGSRWGGVRAYWTDEAETVPPSKPKFRNIELALEKLMAIAYATDELLQDSTAIEAIFRQAFTEEIIFKVEDAIINGDGVGKPLGFVNSGAVLQIQPESGQAGTTVVAMNLFNMLARMPRRSWGNAVWLVNQDALPYLWSLQMPNNGPMLYQPPGLNNNVLANQFGTLLGRPVVLSEYVGTFGGAGDIMLVDFSQYILIDKGGVDWNESMHVRFLYDEMAFRITYRVDGQPTWQKPLTPRNGTNTQSPFISLAARP